MEEQNLGSAPSNAPETEPQTPAPVPAPKKGFAGMLDGYFGITKAGSTIRTEIFAGLITFMTMVYILMVNAGMFSGKLTVSSGEPLSYGAMYITTALAAIVGTLLMAFLAKIPFAQAPGMGLNAFFVFVVCGTYGYHYEQALVIVLVSGILFTCLTFGGVREKIVRAVPTAIRLAIPAGIGLFIAFVGLQNVKIITTNSSTLVQLFPMTVLGDGAAAFSDLMPRFVTILSVIAIAVYSKLNIKGSLLWGILTGTALYYILGGIFCPEIISVSWSSPIDAFREFGTQSAGAFVRGFEGLFSDVGSVFQFIAIFISFAMVDMFDTIGTLIGTATRANMLNEKGEINNMRKALLCDSIATCTGAMLGTSTVTTFVESSAGVAEGGRTGLTALVVAILFFIAMFLSPIAQLIPSCATAAALIYVGVLMMACVTNINWHDPAAAVPAFLTISMMAFTYSISYGIAFGFISYTLIKLCTGKIRRKVDEDGKVIEEGLHPVTVVLAVLFLLNFLLVSH